MSLREPREACRAMPPCRHALGLGFRARNVHIADMETTKRYDAVKTVIWDQPATLIDLDGKAPLISTLRECVRHFVMMKATAQAEARVLLTQPTFREGRKTRTWILEPAEIAGLSVLLRQAEASA
jgi:hypothetical protein